MIGRSIAHYRIFEKLGEGGMGVIYKAQDTKLDRPVALKFLSPQALADEENKARFVHEAKAAAALSHPNICTIHEIDEADGKTFIAMEYVEGVSLKDKIERGPLRLDEAVEIATQVGLGLQRAHEKGIVHRDIKPANVMVTYEGQVKIMDFGLARSAKAGALTKAGTTVGTVAYMSPEQARGDEVDSRTDLWSLGAVLHEMVTGQRAFKGDYDQAVVYSILNVSPEPVTALRTGVPLELEAVITRCLEKDPALRYQTAGDLVADLLRLKRAIAESGLDSRAGPGPPPPTVPGAQSAQAAALGPSAAGAGAASHAGPDVGPQGDEPGPERPRGARRWPWITALIVLAAIVYIVLRPYFSSPGRVEESGKVGESGREAVTGKSGTPAGMGDSVKASARGPISASGRKMLVVLPFANLGPPEDEYFADGMTEEITSRLAAIRDFGVISRTTAFQYKDADKTLRQIGEELGVDYVLEGSVRWEKAGDGTSRVRVTPQLIRVSDDTHLWSERYDDDLRDVFAVQSEIAAQVTERLGVTLLEADRAAAESRPTENLEAYTMYLRGLDYLGPVDWIEENIRLAVQMFERAVELDPSFALAYAELSKAHVMLYWGPFDPTEERLALASKAADRAIELQPGLPEAHIAMGYYYYWGLEEYDKALGEFAVAEESLPNDARIHEAVGYIERRQGKFTDALDELKTAFELSPRDSNISSEIGATYSVLRQYDEAERYFDKAILLAPDQASPYVYKVWNLWYWRGDTRSARAVLDEMPKKSELFSVSTSIWQAVMERDYGRALDGLFKSRIDYIPPQSGFYTKPLTAAVILDDKGDVASARAYYDSARVELEIDLQRSPEDPNVLSQLGIAYAGLGRKEDALRQGKLAVKLYPVSKDAYGGTVFLENLAVIYAMVGEHDAAIDEIEHLLSIPSAMSVSYLRIDPSWDPLRDDPRFKRLLEGQ